MATPLEEPLGTPDMLERFMDNMERKCPTETQALREEHRKADERRATPEYVPVSEEEERRIFEGLARMYDTVHFDPLTPAQQARCMASIAKYNSPETLKAIKRALE